MATDERNQSSDVFGVLALLCRWVVCAVLIGWPLALLYKLVLVPFAFELSGLVVEIVAP